MLTIARKSASAYEIKCVEDINIINKREIRKIDIRDTDSVYLLNIIIDKLEYSGLVVVHEIMDFTDFHPKTRISVTNLAMINKTMAHIERITCESTCSIDGLENIPSELYGRIVNMQVIIYWYSQLQKIIYDDNLDIQFVIPGNFEMDDANVTPGIRCGNLSFFVNRPGILELFDYIKLLWIHSDFIPLIPADVVIENVVVTIGVDNYGPIDVQKILDNPHVKTLSGNSQFVGNWEENYSITDCPAMSKALIERNKKLAEESRFAKVKPVML